MPLPTLANTPHPRAMGYGVAFGDALFRAAFGPGRELQIETAPFEPPAFDTRSNAEELTEETGRTFARDDFTGGEGLDFAHTRAERINKDSRFFDSRNMKIGLPDPGKVREVSLLPVGTWPSASYKSKKPYLAATEGSFSYVYAASNQVILRVNGPGNAVPTFSELPPHAAEAFTDVLDVAVEGESTVYAALGPNGIHRSTNYADAWAHWSDIQADRIWAAKSRIIAAAGQSLYEAVAGAVPTPLYTLPSGTNWRSVVDAGAAILAAASDGNIYAFAPDTTTGVLRLYQQTPLASEYPWALAVAQGIVFYLSRENRHPGTPAASRLWRAELGDDLALTNAQVIHEWPTVPNWAYARGGALTVSRDAVYVAVPESTTETHAWRYDLASSSFTRWVVFPRGTFNVFSGEPGSLAVVAGLLYMAGSSDGLQRSHPTELAASGYLIGPLGDFFTSAVKSWVGARLDADDLPTVADGRTVSLYYSTDPDALTDAAHASWTLVQTWDTASDITTAEMPLTGVESRYIAGKVVMTPSTDLLSSPALRSFGFRGLPGGGGGAANVDQLLNIPINVSDQLERPNKRHVKVKNLGQRDIARLQALQGEALTMTLYHPGGSKQYRGQIESVGIPRHNPERGSATVFSMVKFRGREVAA